MAKVNVLVTVPVEQRHLDMIAAVDPAVQVTYVMEACRAERGRHEGPQGSLYPYLSQPVLTRDEATRQLDGILPDTHVVFAWRLPPYLAARAPGLKWVHCTGAGVDGIMTGTGLEQSGVILTGSSGVRSASVAEFAVCLMIMLAKKAPVHLANQHEHRWQPSISVKLKDCTLGIVGLGNIGSEVARVAAGFRMKVLATRMSARAMQKGADGIDAVFPADSLLEMLPMCDFVVLTAPLTSRTRGLIGETELKSMKPTAYLVNVARGPIIREKALIQALKEGWIVGAALDVFDEEPLPPQSELWGLPNVIITPHTAGYGVDDSTAMTAFFCDNLRRFLTGQPLLNVIDKAKGY